MGWTKPQNRNDAGSSASGTGAIATNTPPRHHGSRRRFAQDDGDQPHRSAGAGDIGQGMAGGDGLDPMVEDEMQIRQTLVSMFAVAILTSASAALAHSSPIGKDFEDGRAAEISSARLRLAVCPAAAGVRELNEAEDALRHLKATKDSGMRRKIAAELDMAVTRLNVVANGGIGEPCCIGRGEPSQVPCANATAGLP